MLIVILIEHDIYELFKAINEMHKQGENLPVYFKGREIHTLIFRPIELTAAITYKNGKEETIKMEKNPYEH